MKRATTQHYQLLRLSDQSGAHPAFPNQPFVALVNGADAPLLALDLPDKLRGQAREQVARRTISDQIGLPADDTELRPFAGKPHAAPWSHVITSAVDKTTQWRDQLDGVKHCAALLPDYLALPAAADIWVIRASETQTSARLGLLDGFSGEHALALALLEQAPKPKAILRLGQPQAALDGFLKSLNLPLFKDTKSMAAADLTVPEQFSAQELSFDLRSNPAAAFDALTTSLRAWRFPIGMGLLALILWSTSTWIATQNLQTATRDLRLQTTQTVREVFVPTGPILDIQTQVSRVLTAAQSAHNTNDQTTSPLDLLQTASLHIANHPATLQDVRHSNDAKINITLLTPDFAALDALVADLDATDLTVRITQSSAADTGGTTAVLELSPKPKASP